MFGVTCTGVLLLLATLAVGPGSCQIVPQLYDAVEVPSQGADCPAPGDTEAARSMIRDDTQTILQDNIVPVLECGLGECQANPADSCDAIYQWNPASPSGNYWLQMCDGSLVQTYCAMGNPCGCGQNIQPGGWRRMAYLNMNDPSMQCPPSLELIADPVRTCGRRGFNHGFAAAFYSSNTMPYSQVCGRVIGYQQASPDAFVPFNSNPTFTIDDPYVDGIMISYGHSPRKHIWTYVAGVDDQGANANRCPCARSDLTYSGQIPPFIGNDWYCDTAPVNARWQNRFYPENALWDGQGCGPQSTCCSGGAPWFCKALTENTTDFIELRFNGDQQLTDEDVPVNLYEIFVK